MDEQESTIRDELLIAAVENWLAQENPFSDIVFRDRLITDVIGRLEGIDKNDVEYVWKLLVEDGYFRKRGKSRRLTAKEIDEAQKLGVEVPLDEGVQREILRVLADAERENVSYPAVSREDLLQELEYDEDVVDYNLFYCRSKGWADVDVYISSNPWESAEITRFGRDVANA
jgi:hypothetical protein